MNTAQRSMLALLMLALGGLVLLLNILNLFLDLGLPTLDVLNFKQSIYTVLGLFALSYLVANRLLKGPRGSRDAIAAALATLALALLHQVLFAYQYGEKPSVAALGILLAALPMLVRVKSSAVALLMGLLPLLLFFWPVIC